MIKYICGLFLVFALPVLASDDVEDIVKKDLFIKTVGSPKAKKENPVSNGGIAGYVKIGKKGFLFVRDDKEVLKKIAFGSEFMGRRILDVSGSEIIFEDGSRQKVEFQKSKSITKVKRAKADKSRRAVFPPKKLPLKVEGKGKKLTREDFIKIFRGKGRRER